MVDYCDILIQAIDTIASGNGSVAQQASSVDETIEPTIKDANPFADILITQNQKATYDSEANTINPGNQILIPTWSLIGIGEKFDLLGVEMVVSTSGTNVSNGNYGVEVTIYGDNRKWISSFNSSEMLGNVNSFTKMLQKKIFDVSEISDIAYIEAKVYNNTSGVELRLHSLELVLGQNLNNVGKDSEPLSLSVTSNGRYETSAAGVVLKGEEQTFNVRYVYQQANGKYRSVTIANEADRPENVFLRWYRYGEAIGGDEYGGANWEYLSSYENKFQITAGMRPGVEEERYKVVALVESEDAQQVNVIESNEVKVTNVKAVSENFISRMELKFLDRSGGTYPYYALDNYIEEAYVTKPLENRTVEVNYKLAIEDSDLFVNISKVVWYYTQNVIIDRTLELESWASERSADGDVNIVTLTKKEGAVSGLEEALKLVYSIPDTRAEMASEGIVKCRIELVDGTFFEASKDIYLTFNGSAGTDYTVIARIYDENYVAQRAYLVDGGNQYLKIRVYDVEGQEITADDKISVSNITGAAVKGGSTNGNQGFSLNVLTLDDVCVVKVTCKIAQKDTDRPLNVEELVPIPITASLGYTYLGPSKVMYDSSGGSPQYNKSALTLLGIESISTWNLVQSMDLENRGLLSTLTGNIFTPVSNYDPALGDPNNISVIKAIELYTQPLIFYQNRYFSRIINEWDGKFQVNESGNYVLASAYVAGSKNNENQFTGTILGELGTITNNLIKESGLFGYSNGVQTFGLKTDGSAFFGASNSGRITFNASGEGVIESGGYIPKTESALGKGTRINLATGSFDFGGGRFVYDGERSLTLTDVTLSWNEIEDIPNLVSKEEYDEFIGEYNNFTDEYQTTIDDIQDQIDTKAQSWYQDSIPTWEAKDNSSHVGDLWHYSGSNNLTNLNNIAFKDGSGATISEIKPHTEWMWKENGGSYYWAEMEIPDEIFDLIDGTSNIFVAKGVTPTVPYNEGDIWIIDWDGTRPTTFPNVAKGTLLTSTTTTGAYSSDHWVEKVKYKDQAALDSLKNEIINTETDSDENTGLVNQLVGEYLGLEGKAFLNGDKIISPYIGGGYLHITSGGSKPLSVTINPNQETTCPGGTDHVFKVVNNGTVVMGVKSDGSAVFSGNVSALSGTIGGTNGFNITTNKIYSGAVAASNSVHLSTEDYSLGMYFPGNVSEVPNVIIENCRFSIGGKFAVTGSGQLYASGMLWVGDNSKIGEWRVGTIPSKCFNEAGYTNALYSCSTSVDSTTINAGATTCFFRPSTTKTHWALAVIEKTSTGKIELFGIKHNGLMYSSGYRSDKLCEYTLHNGEFTMQGTSTRTEVSGAHFNMYGTGQLKDYDNVKLHKDCYVYEHNAWFQQFGYQDQNGRRVNLGRVQWGSNYSSPIGEAGAYTTVNVTGSWYINANITSAAALATSSDRNAKNSIISLVGNKYDALFDLLTPCSFKYNNGTSNRTHIGFIAQDIVSAALQVGFSLQDFAPVCYDEKSQNWSLRYEELIALNTQQIQLLKNRIIQLEEKIKGEKGK